MLTRVPSTFFVPAKFGEVAVGIGQICKAEQHLHLLRTMLASHDLPLVFIAPVTMLGNAAGSRG